MYKDLLNPGVLFIVKPCIRAFHALICGEIMKSLAVVKYVKLI